MTLAYINSTYHTTYKRGDRVQYTGRGQPCLGTVTSARGPYLRVRLDGEKHPKKFHPTWCLERAHELQHHLPAPGGVGAPEEDSARGTELAADKS